MAVDKYKSIEYGKEVLVILAFLMAKISTQASDAEFLRDVSSKTKKWNHRISNMVSQVTELIKNNSTKLKTLDKTDEEVFIYGAHIYGNLVFSARDVEVALLLLSRKHPIMLELDKTAKHIGSGDFILLRDINKIIGLVDFKLTRLADLFTLLGYNFSDPTMFYEEGFLAEKLKGSIIVRYYISSTNKSPESLMKTVREHWKIESLHWLLDVVFSEDECNLKGDGGQKTMNSFRKLALFIHKSHIAKLPKSITIKRSIKNCLLTDGRLIELLGRL